MHMTAVLLFWNPPGFLLAFQLGTWRKSVGRLHDPKSLPEIHGWPRLPWKDMWLMQNFFKRFGVTQWQSSVMWLQSTAWGFQDTNFLPEISGWQKIPWTDFLSTENLFKGFMVTERSSMSAVAAKCSPALPRPQLEVCERRKTKQSSARQIASKHVICNPRHFQQPTACWPSQSSQGSSCLLQGSQHQKDVTVC